MRRISHVRFSHALTGAGLLAVCLLATGAPVQLDSQAGPQTQSQPPRAPQGRSPGATAARPAHPEELLAKARKLYYSYGPTGLEGFDCAVHPDWAKTVVGAGKDEPDAADLRHIQLLSSVKLKLHARLMGDSGLDWDDTPNPGKPLDADSLAELSRVHQAMQRTIQVFLQFWAPFMGGAAVPSSTQGLEIAPSAEGYEVAFPQGDSKVTERFNLKLVLEEYHIAAKDAEVDFAPSYKATGKGLMVSSFTLRIQAPGTDSTQSEEMHAVIGYQTVQGFPIPGKLSVSGSKTGDFDLAFDRCTASRRITN